MADLDEGRATTGSVVAALADADADADADATGEADLTGATAVSTGAAATEAGALGSAAAGGGVAATTARAVSLGSADVAPCEERSAHATTQTTPIVATLAAITASPARFVARTARMSESCVALARVLPSSAIVIACAGGVFEIPSVIGRRLGPVDRLGPDAVPSPDSGPGGAAIENRPARRENSAASSVADW